ncbi:MAG: 50S ribosomal protein L20 [Planctomycetes bacterium]|nr:50S ribosomal protein L20 [Planctomycetota bacterium]
MRATNGAARHRSKARVLKAAKGFYSGRRKMYTVACEAVMRAEQMGFRGRKEKKRDFRRLWIRRISIASRGLGEEGVSYSRLIAGLQLADIRLDRKQLSELAIHQPAAFADVVKQAKAALAAAPTSQGAGAFGYRPQKAGIDNLTIVEGIGPKITELFRANGIDTFAKLAAADPAKLEQILKSGGSHYNTAQPSTWPKQADLVVKGQWAALRKWQDELDGGIKRI